MTMHAIVQYAGLFTFLAILLTHLSDQRQTPLRVQLQYLNLLRDIQKETGVALIFVTHNLGIIAKMCDKVAVMYAGKIVEQGTVREIYNSPKHPYTDALLKSIPKIGDKENLYVIPGQPPNLAELPQGCSFHERCSLMMDKCKTESPPNFVLNNNRRASCWLISDEALGE